MTGPSVVTGSSALPSGNVNAKSRVSSREEEEAGVPPDFLAFAELFTQLNTEDSAVPAPTAAAIAAAVAAAVTPHAPAPLTATPATSPTPAMGEAKEESSALQIAATHSQWFGGESAALSEPVLRRKPPLLIREPEGSLTNPAGAAAASLPSGFAADLTLAKQQASTAAIAAAQHAAPVPPGPAAEDGAVLEAHAELPRGDLLRYQVAMTRPDRGTPPQGTQARGAPPATANQATSAKVQASLSALHAALSEQSLSASGTNTVGERWDDPRPTLKEAGITSVRQETHFAPPSQSPALQIAQRVLRELDMGEVRAIEPSANTMPSASPPVRVMTLQLNPPHLGPMTIRLSLHDEALRLHLETPNPDTAKMIQSERDGLSTLLRSAGYAVESVQVQQIAATDRGAGGQPSTSQNSFSQAAGQQPGWREPQPEGRGAERGGRGPSPQDEAGGRGQDSGPSQAQPGRTRGVYL
jgi:flagellar hook-length control protein FliK